MLITIDKDPIYFDNREAVSHADTGSASIYRFICPLQYGAHMGRFGNARFHRGTNQGHQREGPGRRSRTLDVYHDLEFDGIVLGNLPLQENMFS